MGITFDVAERMFVWERDGRLWFKDPNDASFTLLLDISEEVGAWVDHGFLGFALDPNFRVNGYIYLLYLVDRHHLLNFGTPGYNPNANAYFDATIGRLTRYTCRASDNFRSVDPASRLILIGETKQTGIPVCSSTHGVGSLVFGQDGTLLVSCGEGAIAEGVDFGGPAIVGSYAPQALADGILRPKEDVGAFRAQLVDCLGGKILRIDPATGNGVPSNPFYDAANPRAAKSRVWAMGFRNPFRMTLKPNSGSHNPADGRPGTLYVGNVGWATWESLKIVTGPAQNFGWPIYEGLSLNPGYNIDKANQDAPNPLYPAAGCSQFFSFTDLLKEDTLNVTGQPPFPNPCNSSQRIPTSIPQFLRTRPALDWNHNTVTTRTPIYGPSGQAQTADVGAPGSPVSGTPFAGICSVGGTWYTGTNFPPEYRNLYYHADWGGGVVKSLALDSNDKPFALGSFLDNAGAIVSIVQHPTDGSLYYITYNHITGSIIRLSFAGNRTPVAAASANAFFGPSPLTVQFNSSGSSDPDNQAITYSWNFGDGSPISTQANPLHTFSAPSGVPTTFTVTLTVTDSGGLSAQSTLTVSVNNTPPNVTITSPMDGASYAPDVATTVNLTATVTDAESSDSQLQYRWQTLLHHNEHDHGNPPDTNHATTTVISPTGCDGLNIYYYRIILTVTDPAGLSTTREARLFPNCGPNTPPTISNIPDQTGFLGEAIGPIGFAVGDAQLAPFNLQLSASSSNPTVVPTSNIAFGGSGSNRTITLTPAGSQNGTSTITVTVTDGPLSASDTFLVTATANPLPPNQVTALSFSEGSGTVAADGSGSGHNGTLVNGPTWIAGKFDNGISLDGTNDHVMVANPSTLNFGTGDFTIAAWIKRQATGVEHTILSKTASTSWTTGGKELFVSGSDNRLYFGAFNIAEVSSTSTITNDGLWHHVAVTFVDSTNTVSFYIDGVARGGGPLNLPPDVSSHVIKIGGHPVGHYFRGQVDEFRVFSRALSSAEVQSVMNNAILSAPDTTPPVRSNGQPSGTLPVGTTQTTLSLTTNENATSRYSTVAGTAYGSMQGTFSTTGGTSHSTTITGLTDGSSYTYYVRSIDAAGNANTNDFAISFSIASPPPGTVQLTVINGTGSGFYPINSTGWPVSANPPPAGQQFDMWTGDWQILEGQDRFRPNTTVTIPSIPVTITATYKALPTFPLTVNNGTGSGNYTAGTPVAVSANAAPAGQQFAGWTGNTQFLTGSVSSSSNTVNMPSQPVTITATYQPIPTFPLVVNNGTGSGSYAANTPVTVTANAAPAGQQFNAWIGDTQFLASAASSPTTVTMPSQPVTITATYATIPTTPPNQITALAFNESSGTTCTDSSGSGHNGTLVNGPTRTAGKFGNGISLDGTNDHVLVANPSTLNFGTANFTIALWVKRQATGSEHTILSKTASASWVSGGKEVFISGSDNKVNLGCWGVGEVASTGTITNDGPWHHVAVTFVDSTNTVTFFIDGGASGGGTLNLPADVGSHVVKVGGHPAGHYFRGQVDEFRVFSRALSAGEIQTIMNNAISP